VIGKAAALGILAALVWSCATAPAGLSPSIDTSEHRKAAIELWRTGDDGYTIFFGEALENALADSAVFSPVQVHDPTAMRLWIESNLSPLEGGDDPKAEYVVILQTSDETPLGAIRGKCRRSEFAVCAPRVVASAEQLLLARRSRRPR
jgi:hypothetical protein